MYEFSAGHNQFSNTLFLFVADMSFDLVKNAFFCLSSGNSILNGMNYVKLLWNILVVRRTQP